jgi:formiminoglutamase
MSAQVEMSAWQGRVDSEEAVAALRWHQVVVQLDEQSEPGSMVLLGFACDEGVKRNKGRPGAVDGPEAIRRSLANLSFQGDQPVYDAGNIGCSDGDLEAAQMSLANTVSTLLGRDLNVTVLGGGHEIAWGSYQGIAAYLDTIKDENSTVGIINFDAHLDLRNPAQGCSSGTPFRQIAEWCEQQGKAFRYHVIGFNPSANTTALTEYAKSKNVSWIEDVDAHLANLDKICAGLRDFMSDVDYLYVTICLDVFTAANAPGVSAPASVGISSELVIKLLREIRSLSTELEVPILLSDVAELNPQVDIDQRTARLAARLVWELT